MEQARRKVVGKDADEWAVGLPPDWVGIVPARNAVTSFRMPRGSLAINRLARNAERQ